MTLQPYIPRKSPRVPESKPKPKKRPEAELQNAVIKLLLLHKFLVFRVNASASKNEGRYIRSIVCSNTGKTAGISDVLAMKDGGAFWVECKSKQGRYTSEQRGFAATADSKGIPVYGIKDIAALPDIVAAFERGEVWDEHLAPQEALAPPQWARPKQGQSVQDYLFG